jgi:hypothetical protein
MIRRRNPVRHEDNEDESGRGAEGISMHQPEPGMRAVYFIGSPP